MDCHSIAIRRYHGWMLWWDKQSFKIIERIHKKIGDKLYWYRRKCSKDNLKDINKQSREAINLWEDIIEDTREGYKFNTREEQNDDVCFDGKSSRYAKFY
jgi:hypothetical protein